MTANNIFFMLNEILVKAHKDNAHETTSYVLSEINKLNPNLKVYIVATPTDEIRCKSREMAIKLWESSNSFTELYTINPLGEVHTLKKR